VRNDVEVANAAFSEDQTKAVACMMDKGTFAEAATSTLCKNEKGSNVTSANIAINALGVGGSNSTEKVKSYCSDEKEFKYDEWHRQECTAENVRSTRAADFKLAASFVRSDVALKSWLECVRAITPVNGIRCDVQSGGEAQPKLLLSFTPGVLDRVVDYELVTSNMNVVGTLKRRLLAGTTTIDLGRDNVATPGSVTVNATLDGRGRPSESVTCTVKVPPRSCQNPVYRERATSACDFLHYASGTSAEICGTTSVIGRGPSCGVELYRSAATPACGVLAFNTGQGEVCGCDEYKQQRCRCCAPEGLGPGRCRSRHHGCDYYNRCVDSSFGVASYHTCRNEAHGVELYKECEIDRTPNTCQNEAFGSVFSSCRAAAHGLERCEDPSDAKKVESRTITP
jgi:hypothetical protein